VRIVSCSSRISKGVVANQPPLRSSKVVTQSKSSAPRSCCNSMSFSFTSYHTVKSLSNSLTIMAQDYKHLDPTIFMPHSRLEGLSEYFNCIPHYLLRTSSPRSSSTTTKNLIASAAKKYGLDRSDILARHWEKAVEMLKSHLLWQNRTDNNLTSWTSSFLIAAQHAIR
jgi:hypothetical protein